MNNGIGFFGLLAIVFIGLKLGELGVVAEWSWWWVLSPLWLPTALVVVIGVPFRMIEAARKKWEGR